MQTLGIMHFTTQQLQKGIVIPYHVSLKIDKFTYYKRTFVSAKRNEIAITLLIAAQGRWEDGNLQLVLWSPLVNPQTYCTRQTLNDFEFQQTSNMILLLTLFSEYVVVISFVSAFQWTNIIKIVQDTCMSSNIIL